MRNLLTKIAATAAAFRDERDRHLHRREERSLWGDLDKLVEVVEWSEGTGVAPYQVGILDENGTQSVDP